MKTYFFIFNENWNYIYFLLLPFTKLFRYKKIFLMITNMVYKYKILYILFDFKKYFLCVEKKEFFIKRCVEFCTYDYLLLQNLCQNKLSLMA